MPRTGTITAHIRVNHIPQCAGDAADDGSYRHLLQSVTLKIHPARWIQDKSMLTFERKIRSPPSLTCNALGGEVLTKFDIPGANIVHLPTVFSLEIVAVGIIHTVDNI